MMKLPRNKIQDVVCARISMLGKLAEESQAIDHDNVRGSLREEYLLRFISDFLPSGRAISGGFVIDPAGDMSPQMDLILASTDWVSPLMMRKTASLVPVEAALGIIEVKSTISYGDVNQIRQQKMSAWAIKRIRPMHYSPIRNWLEHR